MGTRLHARSARCRSEVQFWFRVSHAFITYHRRKRILLRSEEEEKKFIGVFLNLRPEDVPGEPEETKFIRECYLAPDGWDEEVALLQLLAEDKNARWSPSDRVKDWPN